MNAQRSLRMATEIGELARIHAAVEGLGQAASWPPDLAVNIINYGHAGDPSHQIEIVLAWEADRLTIEMVDDSPEPDLSSALEDRRVGGLGVYLMHTLMDELHYRREEGCNHLTLIKRRKG